MFQRGSCDMPKKVQMSEDGVIELWWILKVIREF